MPYENIPDAILHLIFLMPQNKGGSSFQKLLFGKSTGGCFKEKTDMGIDSLPAREEKRSGPFFIIL